VRHRGPEHRQRRVSDVFFDEPPYCSISADSVVNSSFGKARIFARAEAVALASTRAAPPRHATVDAFSLRHSATNRLFQPYYANPGGLEAGLRKPSSGLQLRVDCRAGDGIPPLTARQG
jgi:hypothetical protein